MSEILNPQVYRIRHEVNVSSAVYISDNKGRLLLLQQAAESKGKKWGPPGGGMEEGETPIDAAIRETKEEIRVGIKLIDLIGIYSRSKRPGVTGMAFAFRGKIISGKIDQNPEEIIDYKYFSLAEIKKMSKVGLLYMPEYNKLAIKDWQEGRSYPLDLIKPLIE